MATSINNKEILIKIPVFGNESAYEKFLGIYEAVVNASAAEFDSKEEYFHLLKAMIPEPESVNVVQLVKE